MESEWVQTRTVMPIEEHEPFSLAQFLNINDHIPSASSFKFSISTKFLLQLAKYSDHTCTQRYHSQSYVGMLFIIFEWYD